MEWHFIARRNKRLTDNVARFTPWWHWKLLSLIIHITPTKSRKRFSSLTVVDVGMNRWNPQIFPENFDLFVADPGAHFVFTFVASRYKRTTKYCAVIKVTRARNIKCDATQSKSCSDLTWNNFRKLLSQFSLHKRRSFYWLRASIVLSAIVVNCIMIRRRDGRVARN